MPDAILHIAEISGLVILGLLSFAGLSFLNTFMDLREEDHSQTAVAETLDGNSTREADMSGFEVML